MANKKITELTALAVAAADDVLAIVDVSGTAETKKITVANLTGGGDEYFIFNGGGYVSTANEMAITFGMSTQDTSNFSYVSTAQIPFNCRLVSVRSFSQSSGGSTDIRAYKPTSIAAPISDFTALGTVNIASHTLGTPHLATFDSAIYDYAAGENIGITFDSTFGSNLNGLIVTILLKKV